MAKKHYLPRSGPQRAIWLNTFNKQINQAAPAGPAANLGEYLGLLPGEVAQTAADNAMYSFCIQNQKNFNQEKKERTTYKNLLDSGKEGETMNPYPTVPVVAPPPPVPQGIFKRIPRLVARIKSSPHYTPSIGKDLGIIGAEQTLDLNTLKPRITLQLTGGGVVIKWKKKQAHGLQIFVNRGEGYELLTTDLQPPYTDAFPLPATAASWKYKAIYVIDDEQAGQWSGEVRIEVARE